LRFALVLIRNNAKAIIVKMIGFREQSYCWKRKKYPKTLFKNIAPALKGMTLLGSGKSTLLFANIL